MFEEEFFVSVLSRDDEHFIYKYFSTISDEQADLFNNSEPNGTNTLERSNLLGATIVSQSPWIAKQQRLQCLLKLYDKDIREFKLQDCVTFVGIFESKPTIDCLGDSQMDGEFQSGAP